MKCDRSQDKTFPNRDDIAFVRGIFEATKDSPAPSLVGMQRLARLAFRGGFMGGGAYFRWNCGSWLDQRLGDFIRASETASGRLWTDVLVEVGTDESDYAWCCLVDSYLLLPGLCCYKSVEEVRAPTDAPESWHRAFRINREQWLARSHPPPFVICRSRPFDERLDEYIESNFHDRYAKYMGSRLSRNEENRLLERLVSLRQDQASELWSRFATSKKPWWRRFAKRYPMAR